MPPDRYRLYRLDGAGMIHDAEWFDAEDDADAASRIESKHPDASCEIWHGTRLVVTISPSRRSA